MTFLNLFLVISAITTILHAFPTDFIILHNTNCSFLKENEHGWDLRCHSLEYVPPLPTNISRLFLGDGQLKYVHNDSLTNGYKLKEIDISYNKIEYIGSDVFCWSKKLEILNLKHNCLTSLPEKLFWRATHLQKLDLSDNKLEYFPKMLFEFTNNLTELILSNNWKLKIVSDMLPNYLLSLNLENTDVGENIPDFFCNISTLTNLNLANNGITYVNTKAFYKLKQLKYLNLGENNLKTLPDKIFSENRYLENLTLASNRLEKLPPTIFDKNMRLKRLILSENTALKFATSYLPMTLKYLDFKNTSITLDSDVYELLFAQNRAKYEGKINDCGGLAKLLKDLTMKRKLNIICPDGRSFKEYGIHDYSQLYYMLFLFCIVAVFMKFCQFGIERCLCKQV